MSAPLVIPFNFQPSSVAVHQGAYTIPSGYYAFVTASVTKDSTFFIDSVVALTATTNSDTLRTNTSSSLRMATTPADALLIATTGPGTADALGYTNHTLNNSSAATASYWVPEGTVLDSNNNSGAARYTTTLYPNVS